MNLLGIYILQTFLNLEFDRLAWPGSGLACQGQASGPYPGPPLATRLHIGMPNSSCLAQPTRGNVKPTH